MLPHSRRTRPADATTQKPRMPPLVSKIWSTSCSTEDKDGPACDDVDHTRDPAADVEELLRNPDGRVGPHPSTRSNTGTERVEKNIRPKSAGAALHKVQAQKTGLRGEPTQNEEACSFGGSLADSRHSPNRATKRVVHPRPRSAGHLLQGCRLGDVSPYHSVVRQRPASACGVTRCSSAPGQTRRLPGQVLFSAHTAKVLQLVKQIERTRPWSATGRISSGNRSPHTTTKPAKAPLEAPALKIPPKIMKVYSSPSPINPSWKTRRPRSRSPLPPEAAANEPVIAADATQKKDRQALPKTRPQTPSSKATRDANPPKDDVTKALKGHLQEMEIRLLQNHQKQRNMILPRRPVSPVKHQIPRSPRSPTKRPSTPTKPQSPRSALTQAILKHRRRTAPALFQEEQHRETSEEASDDSGDDTFGELPLQRAWTSPLDAAKISSQLGKSVDELLKAVPSRNARKNRRHSTLKGDLTYEVKLQADKIFKEMASHGEVITDLLPEALDSLGYKKPDKNLILHIVEQVFGGRSFLDREEFFEFVHIYEEKYWCHIKGRFKETDLDGSGSIGASELVPMLRKAGITPLRQTVDELIFEVTGVGGGAGQLGLREYVRILDIIHDRAGFTTREAQRLSAAFSQRAMITEEDPSEPVLATMDVSLVLVRLRIEFNLQEMEELDPDGLSEVQFLQLVRRCREHELAKVHTAFSDLDTGHKGVILPTQLPRMMELLGLGLACPQAVQEAVADCRLQNKAELMYEEVTAVVERFRETEGLTVAELTEVDATFAQFEEELRSGEGVSGFEIVKALRWYGYPATLEDMQALAVEHMLGEAGPLERRDLSQIVAHCRAMELMQLKQLLPNDPNMVPSMQDIKRELQAALEALGHGPTIFQVEELLSGNGSMDRRADLWDLAHCTAVYRLQARDRLRASQGFNDIEVQKFRAQFKKHDNKNKGVLSKQPLRQLLMEIFPNVSVDQKEHAIAKKLLEVVDVDHNHEIDFEEFLRLMRLLRDLQVKERIAHQRKKVKKERDAVRNTRFTNAEITDFRSVFRSFDRDGSGDISIDEFETMIGCVLNSNTRQDMAQTKRLMDSADVNRDKVLDFSEFLFAMRKVLDEDWHNIRSATRNA